MRWFVFFLFCLPLWAAPAMSAAPQVAVSIKPLYGLVAAVMDGVGEPELIMDGMASPHTFQLRPSTAAMIVNADLVVWVGPGVESAFPAALGMASAQTRIIEAASLPGITLLPARSGGVRTLASEPDDHAARDDDHAHGPADPHIWLSPRNAIIITQTIVEELAHIDPAHAEVYRANGAQLRARISVLEHELTAALAPVQGIPVMTFHDAYQYFEASFGLTNVASIAISPDRPPGARTVMDLRYAIMDGGIVCVFSEPQFEPALVVSLVEGTEARLGILDPMGAAVDPGPSAYIQLMTRLAENVLSCVEGPPSSE